MATPTRRFKQLRIVLNWKGKNYYDIRAESLKPTLKQEDEEYTATNQIKPYAKAFEGQTYEFQLNGLDPEHYALFKEIFKEQVSAEIKDLFKVATYDYTPEHELRMKDWFGGCSISEMSNESAEPFDVKMTAIDWK